LTRSSPARARLSARAGLVVVLLDEFGEDLGGDLGRRVELRGRQGVDEGATDEATWRGAASVLVSWPVP
jgi:hypothetical protein